MDVDEIDWERLADHFGAAEAVSGRHGHLALAEIIGADRIRASVDWYVEGRPGAELARHALWRLQPVIARDRCVEIWRSDDAPTRRQTAVELLRVVATADDIDLIADFLGDPDELVQVWGFGILDQLLWSNQVDPDDAEPMLATAANHSNPAVRERCGFIRSYLWKRAEGTD